MVNHYLQLIRFDKPIGSMLLLWHTLMGLWFANHGMPKISLLTIFIVGVFVMRSAGCVINDIWDRNFDRYVTRTKNRPLATKAISLPKASALFIGLLGCGLLLVLQLNIKAILLAIIAALLIVVYPLMKRVTFWPQAVLGITFSFAIPIAYAASYSHISTNCLLLMCANFFWIIAYDTQYAIVDRDDDRQIGVKSTAILFAGKDKVMIILLQALFISTMLLLGVINKFTSYYYLGLLMAGTLFIRQTKSQQLNDRQQAMQAFLANNYVGLVVVLGIIFGIN